MLYYEETGITTSIDFKVHYTIIIHMHHTHNYLSTSLKSELHLRTKAITCRGNLSIYHMSVSGWSLMRYLA